VATLKDNRLPHMEVHCTLQLAVKLIDLSWYQCNSNPLFLYPGT